MSLVWGNPGERAEAPPPHGMWQERSIGSRASDVGRGLGAIPGNWQAVGYQGREEQAQFLGGALTA